MTPREIDIKAKVFAENYKNESNEKITIAYLTAMWAAQNFSKNPPKPLSEILNISETEKEGMTDEDMLEEVKRLNASLGGTVY